MIDKSVATVEDAVAEIADGSTIMIGGFGPAGAPFELLAALALRRAKDLTLISNNAGTREVGISALLHAGLVRKMICSYPRSSDSVIFNELYRDGKIELELVPQGNLAARIQAAGEGLGGIYTPVGYGTDLTKDKESRCINGVNYVFELPLKADVALIHGHCGDRWGNLSYSKAGRNFCPIMAMAATYTIAEVTHLVALGDIDPENIITPGIFVQCVVPLPAHTPPATTV